MGKQASCLETDVGSSKLSGGTHLQKSRLLLIDSGLAGISDRIPYYYVQVIDFEKDYR